MLRIKIEFGLLGISYHIDSICCKESWVEADSSKNLMTVSKLVIFETFLLDC